MQNEKQYKSVIPPIGSHPFAKRLRIAAVMSVFNEEDVIFHSVKYLIDQGIRVHILDNGSTDSTRGIIEGFRSPLISISDVDTGGKLNMVLLAAKRREVLKELEKDNDWVMVVDDDEYWESPYEGVSLREAIELVHRTGKYNCIGLREFLFLPMSDEAPHVPGDDVRKYYDHYRTKPLGAPIWGSHIHPEHDRIWKTALYRAGSGLTLTSIHRIDPEEKIRIFPDLFIIRHYRFREPESTRVRLIKDRKERLSADDIERKYCKYYLKINEDSPMTFDHKIGITKRWSEFKKLPRPENL